MQENDKKIDLFLTAINPYIVNNMVNNTEKKINGKDFVTWGDNNGYPNFLWDCYSNCTTLQSIINGITDYVVGDGIECNLPQFNVAVNKKRETITDIIQKITMDYLIFGSFAIQVIRNMSGNIAEIYWVDVAKLRSDEKNEIFYYSDDWNKSYGRVKYIQYPKFGTDDYNPTSIFYYKGNKTRTVYGQPLWGACTKNVMIDMNITDFHLNEINNNFMGSKVLSFNNGIPDDELKTEIERNLNEKFSGAENAGRFLISFAQSKENAPEILDLGTDNFDTRYETLEKRNTQQIFVAFRTTPLLLGMVTESNGFATNEYRDSYKLFNKTMVQPIQNLIIDSFDKIFGVKNSAKIEPFTIRFEDEEKQL